MSARSRLHLLALLTFSVPTAARADSPIYFWGLQRDCEQYTSVNRAVEKQLHSAAQPFALLHSPDGKPLPPCQGERCAQILRQACPSVSGRLLGGVVVEGRDTSRFRLWLADLSSGQIAFQDDYTQNLDIANAFVVQAKALLQNPRIGSAPDSKPSYCRAMGNAQSSAAGGPVFLTVYGDGKHRTAVQVALTEQLQLLGKSPLPLPFETRSYSLDILQRIVAEKQSARVLGAEIKKDNTVRLFLFDQNTNITHDNSLSCANCERDNLILQVKQGVSELLEHCFTSQCAQSGVQPPVEACGAFPDKQCGDVLAILSPGASLPARHIDPTTGKIVKGGLWGLFAASAAAAIGLYAANAAGAGRLVGVYEMNTQPLINPAYAATAIAGLSLGVAIPVTFWVNRVQSQSLTIAQQPGAALVVQCPN
jgi:hypothetical protein